MKKACVELDKHQETAKLFVGEKCGGQCLHSVDLSTREQTYAPTPHTWSMALDECLRKAHEMKYEVKTIRGQELTLEQKNKNPTDTKSDDKSTESQQLKAPK